MERIKTVLQERVVAHGAARRKVWDEAAAAELEGRTMQ